MLWSPPYPILLSSGCLLQRKSQSLHHPRGPDSPPSRPCHAPPLQSTGFSVSVRARSSSKTKAFLLPGFCLLVHRHLSALTPGRGCRDTAADPQQPWTSGWWPPCPQLLLIPPVLLPALSSPCHPHYTDKLSYAFNHVHAHMPHVCRTPPPPLSLTHPHWCRIPLNIEAFGSS